MRDFTLWLCLLLCGCGSTPLLPVTPPMPVTSKPKIAGLFTNGNQVSGVPDGALSEANNVVLRSNGLLEPRRGMGAETNTFGTTTTPRALAYYGNGRIIQYSEGGSEKLAYSTTAGGAWTAYSGTYSPVDTSLLRMKFVEANQNLYFNTSVGLKVLTSLTGTPTFAGVSTPAEWTVGVDKAVAPPSSGAWLAPDSGVAYRVVIGIKDANNNLKLSAPTGRLLVQNVATVTVASGSLVRAGNIVTATVTSNPFVQADQVVLTNPDGTFGAGPFAVTSGATTTTFSYAETAANATSAIPYTFNFSTKRVALAFLLDTGLTTNHFFRLYRTLATTAASTDPGDEMYLIYERKFTATEISNRVVSLFDTTPESSLYSSPLYTNPKTGEGISAANDVAPISKDLAFWQNRLWLANTTDRPRMTLQMIGTSAPDGVQHGDLLTIGERTYRFKGTGGSSVSGYASVHIEQSVSLGTSIHITALYLVDAINEAFAAGTSSVRASYVSQYGDAPGKLLLEGTLGGSSFYVAASRPSSFAPVPSTLVDLTELSSSRTGSTVTITTATSHGYTVGQQVYLASNSADANFPVGLKTIATTPTATTFTYTESGSAVTMSGVYQVLPVTTSSTSEQRPNGITYSKFQEPEAVPLLNYITVGAKNKEIKRIIPLRDKLYVFKDDGIFIVSGQAPYLSVDSLDPTVKLLAPDSVVTLGNLIYALTNQGVVTVSESGVSVISYPIESDLLAAAYNYGISPYTWAASYESDRCYILGMPNDIASSSSQYVYNYMTKAWTTWSLPGVVAAGVDPASDALTVANTLTEATTGDNVSVERKASGASQYYDATENRSTTAVDTSSQILSVSGSFMATGSLLADEGATVMIRSAGTTNVSYSYGTGGQANVSSSTSYAPIVTTVKFVHNPLGAPAITKHYKEAMLHFRAQHLFLVSATFANEYVSSTASVVEAEGTFNFASPTTVQRNIRILVPSELQRGTTLQFGFTVAQAKAFWQLEGYSFDADLTSQRVNR